MSLDSTTTVTIEQLDEILRDDAACCALSILFKLLGFKPKECRRKAVVLLVMTCGGCGTTRRGICRRHLRLLQSDWTKATCNSCRQAGTWKIV